MKSPLTTAIVLTVIEVMGAIMIFLGSFELAAVKHGNPAHILIPLGSLLVAIGGILHAKWKPIEKHLNQRKNK